MGTVYAAHDPALDRRVALKLIRAAATGPELEARLLREAKAMARLSHPEVISVFDAGRDGDRLFIAMELIDGGTLRQWLVARPRTWREIIAVFVRAGRGLAQAHASGLVHRDFKPDNVLISHDGKVRVTDFGLARDLEEAPLPGAGEEPDRPAFAGDPYLTQTGALLGTPAYMAPEQLAGAKADARSDLFAYCVALYEALYGERPFDGKTLIEQRDAKREGKVRPPRADRKIPARVGRVVLAGLRARPEERYGSMDALLDALERAARPPLGLSSRWLAAVAGAVVVAGIVFGMRAREHPVPAGKGEADAVRTAVAALAGPDARLACPIFEVRGMDEIAGRLGAAAGTLACARASWNLGGRDDRVLPPAALLGVPAQPVDGFADPYLAQEQRARTLELARARGAAYVDGTVLYDHASWSVEVTVRAPNDEVITRAQATDAKFLSAVKKALHESWGPPLVRREIDPDVARWTGFSDVDLGLASVDVHMMDSPDECGAIRARAGELGNAFFPLEKICEQEGAESPPDAGMPTLDESSPPALVASARALFAVGKPVPVPEARRFAEVLEKLRDSESSSVGRAFLADAAGVLWYVAKEPERVEASLRLALREDPLLLDAWHFMIVVAAGRGSEAPAASIASAWLPSEASFVAKAGSYRGDELDARLRDARLAYVLEPGFTQAMHIGRALAEAGRADDVREIAAASLESDESSRLLKAYLLAFVALHDAKMARAIPLLEEAGNIGMTDLVVVADVAGRAEETATRWAARFLSLPDVEVDITARGYDAPMVLCMRARRDLALRCLDRVDRLGHAAHNWWYEGGEALLQGARSYAAGDLRGAVSAWRPLVAGPNLEIARILPTEAFERAGESELAARIDTRKLPFTFIAGVSDAAPREAKRALAAGDAMRARELAQAVVHAWEVADLEVPAVARMRTLLKATDR
jgi:hypothetical protein